MNNLTTKWYFWAGLIVVAAIAFKWFSKPDAMPAVVAAPAPAPVPVKMV